MLLLHLNNATFHTEQATASHGADPSSSAADVSEGAVIDAMCGDSRAQTTSDN